MSPSYRFSRLEWDSTFFNLEVYHVEVSNDITRHHLMELRQQLQAVKADVAYLWLSDHRNADSLIGEIGGILYDQKVLFKKDLDDSSTSATNPELVRDYTGPLNDELIELALIAGSHSRFNKDPRFHAQFKKLYEQWMVNSLSKINADHTFVFDLHGSLTGMITVQWVDQAGRIGLIATLPEAQGQGIGKTLIKTVEAACVQRNIYSSQVATQLTNSTAMTFYQHMGYRVQRIDAIYHLWLN